MLNKTLENKTLENESARVERNAQPWKPYGAISLIGRCLSGVTLALGLGCNPSVSTPPAEGPHSEAPHSPQTTSEVPEKQADKAPQEPQRVVILAEVGFKTPESVYFDKRRDVYLVSNINGSPTDADQNGFISRLTPQSDGTYAIDLKFIDGTKKETPLSAPKGITVVGDTLYVTDIDRIRKFSAITGSARGEILLEGSTFMNDLATGEKGVIYASDSGLTPSFESSGTDAIYQIAGDDKVKKLASGTDLGGPNGLIATKGGVWVATFRSGEVYWLSDAGEKSSVQKMPQGGNDGIVADQSGRLLVASWDGGAVLSGQDQGTFGVEVSGVPAPADIGYDCTRNKLLIPLFKEDKVIIHQLDK